MNRFIGSIFLALAMLSSLLIYGEETTLKKETTICLNMIVKNERDVIRRCLDSVRPIIDYWVIVDTGSADGTQDIIREHLKDIPGELHEHPWRNFGFNRTQALKLAKGKAEYLLIIDADDTLEFTGEFSKDALTHDLYYMWAGIEQLSYLKPHIIRANMPWKWVGVTHEYLSCAQEGTSETLQNVRYVHGDGGASHKERKKKFLTNIRLLLNGLKKDPNNSRYAFYLASSFRDAGEKGKALEWYQRRISMGGWEEEVFWSKFQVAAILFDLGASPNLVLEAYKDAYHYRPHRLEPIYFLTEMLNAQERYSEAYEYLKAVSLVPKPAKKDKVFNLDWIEKYGVLFQLSIASYYVGHHEESLHACDTLLAMKDLPEPWRNLVEQNRTYSVVKLESNGAAAK